MVFYSNTECTNIPDPNIGGFACPGDEPGQMDDSTPDEGCACAGGEETRRLVARAKSGEIGQGRGKFGAKKNGVFFSQGGKVSHFCKKIVRFFFARIRKVALIFVLLFCTANNDKSGTTTSMLSPPPTFSHQSQIVY